MSRFLFLVPALMIMVSCQSSKYDFKLSDEQLAHLVLDLQLAEVALMDMSAQQQDSIKLFFEKKLEEIYHLPYSELKNEIDLLQTDPKKLKMTIDRAKQMADSIQ
ncbi:MAG TPA: hypothetical protein VFG10_07805 [Saprospiraceae bacterium]|nr:hypothetical protein [Saprospiraceae bacterium]